MHLVQERIDSKVPASGGLLHLIPMQFGTPIPRELQDLRIKAILLEVSPKVNILLLLFFLVDCLLATKGSCRSNGLLVSNSITFVLSLLQLPQAAMDGVHLFVTECVKNGTPAMLCGSENTVRTVVDQMKKAVYPINLSTYPITMYRPGGQPPYNHHVVHITIITTQVIDFTVCLFT